MRPCVRGSIVLFAMASMAAGCAGMPRPKLPFTDSAEALSLHALSRAVVQSIQAEARVDQRGAHGRIKGTVLMFVQRPDRVRFDVMTQFGPAAILTSDGERFAFSDLRERRYLTGPTCPKNIARLLNIPLNVEETTLLLLGGTPVLAQQRARIDWNSDGFYRLHITGRDGRRQEVDFGISEHDAKLPKARQQLRLLRSEIYDARGDTQWRVSYGEYRPLQLGTLRVAMPFLVRVEQPKIGADTLIRFKQMNLEATVPQDAFMQVPLPGMHQEDANCD